MEKHFFSQMHALVSGNSELTRLLDLLEHRFSELVEDISRTREELSAQFQLSQLFKSENEYLENTVEKHRRENERLTEQNQLLLMEFEDLKHFSSDKEHQIAFMQEQTAFFESENLRLQEELYQGDDNNNNAISQEIQEIERIKRSELIEENQELKKRLLKHKQALIPSFRQQISNLQQTILEQKEENNQLEYSLQNLKITAQTLKTQLDKSEKNEKHLKLAYDQLRQNNEAEILRKEFANIKQLYQTNKQLLDDQKNKSEVLIKENEKLKSQNNEILSNAEVQYSELKLLKELIHSKDEQMDKLIQENTALQNLQRNANESIKQLQTEKAGLQAKVKQQEDEKQNALEEQKKLQNQQFTETTLKFQIQLDEQHRRTQQLESQIFAKEDEVRVLKKQATSKNFFQLQIQNQQLQQTIFIKDREILHLSSTLERLEVVNKQLQQECDKLAQKMQQTAQDNQILSRTNRDLSNVSRFNIQGQYIKEFLEKKSNEREKNDISIGGKLSQIMQQQNISRRQSVKK